MQLTKITQITGQIKLLSGLHIGSGNTEMHIGGTDSPVIKNPITNQPYIPGSSIKGKMRSLMEWQAGVVGISNGEPLGFRHLKDLKDDQREAGETILRLFGGAPEGADQDTQLVERIGPARLAFWDCELDAGWVREMRDEKNLLLTEVKMENTIDRITSVAKHPRNTERVPAGARFDFRLTLRIHDGDTLLDDILRGLRLLELTGLGGSGSRGYGKLCFVDLAMESESLMERLEAIEV